MKLINATGERSKVGTIVKFSDKKGGFVFAKAGERGDLYIVVDD